MYPKFPGSFLLVLFLPALALVGCEVGGGAMAVVGCGAVAVVGNEVGGGAVAVVGGGAVALVGCEVVGGAVAVVGCEVGGGAVAVVGCEVGGGAVAVVGCEEEEGLSAETEDLCMMCVGWVVIGKISEFCLQDKTPLKLIKQSNEGLELRGFKFLVLSPLFL